MMAYCKLDLRRQISEPGMRPSLSPNKRKTFENSSNALKCCIENQRGREAAGSRRNPDLSYQKKLVVLTKDTHAVELKYPFVYIVSVTWKWNILIASCGGGGATYCAQFSLARFDYNNTIIAAFSKQKKRSPRKGLVEAPEVTAWIFEPNCVLLFISASICLL